MGQVFVSWSGESGRRVAELLKNTLLDLPDVTAFVSSRDVRPGHPWLEEITKKLDSSQHAIACLTPGTFSAPWINFESGFVFGRLKSLYVLTIGEELPDGHPLRTLQTLNGLKIDDLHKLFNDLRPAGGGSARRWVESQFPEWKKGCDEILGNRPELASLSTALQSVQNAARQMEANIGIFANLAFRSVIRQSLEEIINQLNSVFTTFSVSADHTPCIWQRSNTS